MYSDIRMQETSMDVRERKLFTLQAQLCQLLADPTRLELLHLIGDGEQTVGELIAATGLRQANVSQHLSLLRQRGMVATRREGTTVFYHLVYPEILEACALTRRILLRQLEAARELVSLTTEG